jgi:type IX secretion system PorP/SprF family membrane protein
MKKLLFIVSLVICGSSAAQQLSHFTQQPFMQVLVNPAFAGNARCTELKSVHRAQWVGIDGAPQTTNVAVTGRIGKQSNQIEVFHGFAFRFENDRFGPFQHNKLHGAYAIHLPFKNEHFLSFGTYFGFDNVTFDNTNLNPLVGNDQAVQNSRYSFMGPDFSFGTKYNTKKLFFGLTFLNLVPLRYPIGNDARKVFHANFTTGAQLPLGDSDWSFSPMLNMRFAARTPVALDVYALADYRQAIYFGAGFRNQESAMFLARFRVLDQFKVGYSFDWVFNRLRGGMGHTHEITLSISACKSRKTGTTVCPVFE